MTDKQIAATVVLGVQIALCCTTMAQVLKESPSGLSITENSAKPGDVFKGVVIRQSKNELYVDTTPCDAPEHKIKAFTQPFVKRETGEEVTCGEKKFKIVRVEKK